MVHTTATSSPPSRECSETRTSGYDSSVWSMLPRLLGWVRTQPRTVPAVAGFSLGDPHPDLNPERPAVQCETPIPARGMDPRGPPCKTWPAPRSCRHGSPPTTARRSGAGRSQGRLFACRARQRPRPSTTRIALAVGSKNRTRTESPGLRAGGAWSVPRIKAQKARLAPVNHPHGAQNAPHVLNGAAVPSVHRPGSTAVCRR